MKNIFLIFLFTCSNLFADGQSVRITRGPYLQAATPNSIVIRWRTNVPTASVVKYGMEECDQPFTTSNGELTTEHIVKLEGLEARTRYFYSIGTNNEILQGNCENYFQTLPPAGEKGVYYIGAFGDCGTDSRNQRRVRNSFLRKTRKHYVDAWILLGDNAYWNGTDQEYSRKFFSVYQRGLLKRFPLFPGTGNHDYANNNNRKPAQAREQMAYFRSFTMPVLGESGGVPSNDPAYYSFDIGNIHFIALDSYGRDDDGNRVFDTSGAQVQWLKKDLEANTNRDWVVVFFHHPPYTMGSHNSDKETELVLIRERLVYILERYKVDLVLTGHSHNYERSRLMRGHYGYEHTFRADRDNLSSSNGYYNNKKNCPYVKDSTGRGTVYVVNGSSGQLDEYTEPGYPHNAMPIATSKRGGSLLLKVEDNRMDVQWIAAGGRVRDRFVIMKNVNQRKFISVPAGETVQLTASFISSYRWQNASGNDRTIQVSPPPGVHLYRVRDKFGCLTDDFLVRVRAD